MKTLRIDGKDYQVEDPVADYVQQAAKRAEAAEASDKASIELRTALGVDSHEKALGTIVGLKAKAEQADKARAELEKLQAEQLLAKRTGLLDAATRDGRITPAKRAELLAAEGSFSWAKDVAALEGCLSMFPKPGPEPREPAAPAPAALTADDETVAKQLGLDLAAVAAAKKQ